MTSSCLLKQIHHYKSLSGDLNNPAKASEILNNIFLNDQSTHVKLL